VTLVPDEQTRLQEVELGGSRSVAARPIAPPLAIVAAALPAHRAGERGGARHRVGREPYRRGLPQLRRGPRLRRLLLLRAATSPCGRAARGQIGDAGGDPARGSTDLRLLTPDKFAELRCIRGGSARPAAHGQARGGSDARPVGSGSGPGLLPAPARRRRASRHGYPGAIRVAGPEERRAGERKLHAARPDSRPPRGRL